MVTALVLLAAGCGKANTSGTASVQAPAATPGTMGIITQIGSDSITLAVMPQGAGPQGGQPGGGAPQVSGAPQGGNGAQQPQMDTSGWEKKSYKIDSGTQIVQGGSNGGAALKLSDLKTGESVAVTERSGAAGTAGQITVMQFGQGGPGGPGGQGAPLGSAPAPRATSKS